MKYFVASITFCLALSSFAFQTTRERLKEIDPLIKSNIDSAIVLSKELLAFSEARGDAFGIVKTNLYLGFLTKKKQDIGKSVIYFLEGIRQADKLHYEGIEIDRVWLRRNIANTFRTFQANELATKYNLEAIDIAEKENIEHQIISLNYNQGLVFQDDKNYESAIRCFERVLEICDESRRYEMINQIGLVYLDSKNYELAKNTFESLLDLPAEFHTYSAKALHNLGELNYEQGKNDKSIELLRSSIELKNSLSNTDHYSLFNSYRSIGRYLYEANNTVEAEKYLLEAEEIFSHAEWDQRSYEIFKTLSTLYYSIDNNTLGEKYSELYYTKVQEYLDTQREIQQQDKEYNFDLITKRYFDEVESQERIASIMHTSKLSIGGLLAVLLLTIAYFRIEKLRTRRSIERELAALNMIDWKD